MENKERKPKIIAVDRRGYHGVTLTRKAAERYGFERMLRLPGNYRKIEAEAFKGNLKIEQIKHWKKLICRIVYSRSETELSGAVRCLRTFISRRI